MEHQVISWGGFALVVIGYGAFFATGVFWLDRFLRKVGFYD